MTGYIIYYQQDGGQRLSVSAEVAATTAAITGLEGGTYSIAMVTTSSTLPSTETAAQTVTLGTENIHTLIVLTFIASSVKCNTSTFLGLCLRKYVCTVLGLVLYISHTL